MNDQNDINHNEHMERVKVVWDKLPYWLQIKIFLSVLWRAVMHLLHQVPIHWVKLNLREGRNLAEEL